MRDYFPTVPCRRNFSKYYSVVQLTLYFIVLWRCWLRCCGWRMEYPLHPEEDSLGTCEDVASFSQGSAAILAIRALVTEILSIEAPSLKEYALAFQVALQSSWVFLSAWGSVFALVLSPVLQLLAVLAGAVWPHARSGAISLWRFQASLSLYTVCAEVAVAAFVILVVLLRRFIVRHRYIPRAQRRVLLFRARVNRGYLSFTASVERKFRLSARAFPHVVYWAAAAAFGWLAPDFSAALRDKTWVFVTVTWPTLYALYLTLLIRGQGPSGGPPGQGERTGGPGKALAVAAGAASTTTSRSPVVRAPRRSPMSPGEAALARRVGVTPHDVDRVLMYWVVFTVARCCGALPGYVPFASSVVESLATSAVRTAAFFLVLWVHLPGPGSGLEVVYASLEPLVHTYVKDLRPAKGYTGELQRLQDVLVFVRVLTKEHAQVLAENVTDSWMLLPVPLFFFTPSFIAFLGCLYAGLVVPALNSIKTLGRRSIAAGPNGSLEPATPAGASRVRWLTYWVSYGGWWHVAWCMGGLLRIIPLTTHVQLVLFLWLQVPVFRGSGRILDLGELCLERWASDGGRGGGSRGGRSSP